MTLAQRLSASGGRREAAAGGGHPAECRHAMRRLLCLALFLAACSGGEAERTATSAPETKPATPPPSVAEAREIVASSAELGEYRFTDAGISLPVAGSMMNEPARVTAKALTREGWIALDGAGDATLTAKAQGDKRFLLRPNGLLDIVPLAKKEMGEVSAVRLEPDGTAIADFTWSWAPNEIGALMEEKFPVTRHARSSLRWDGLWLSVVKGVEGGGGRGDTEH